MKIIKLMLLLSISMPLWAQEIQQLNINNNLSYVTTLAHGGRSITFDIPQGAIGSNCVLKVNFDPISASIEQNSAALLDSLNKLPWNEKYFNQYVFEFQVYVNSQAVTTNFTLPIKITINYDDSNNDNIIDNTDPIIFENQFKAFVLQSGSWSLVDDQSADTSAKNISFFIEKSGCAALLGQVNYSQNVDNVLIYPNPIKLNKTNSFGGTRVTFSNIPTDAAIKICTLDGGLVRDLEETNNDGKLEWDLLNSAGKTVSSGIYIALIKSGNSKKVYRVAVER